MKKIWQPFQSGIRRWRDPQESPFRFWFQFDDLSQVFAFPMLLRTPLSFSCSEQIGRLFEIISPYLALCSGSYLFCCPVAHMHLVHDALEPEVCITVFYYSAVDLALSSVTPWEYASSFIQYKQHSRSVQSKKLHSLWAKLHHVFKASSCHHARANSMTAQSFCWTIADVTKLIWWNAITLISAGWIHMLIYQMWRNVCVRNVNKLYV